MSDCRFTTAQAQCYEALKNSVSAKNFELCDTVIGQWRQIAAAESHKNTCRMQNACGRLSVLKAERVARGNSDGGGKQDNDDGVHLSECKHR